MTIRELLTRVDALSPNGYTDGEKIHMINQIEGRIYHEIINRTEGSARVFTPFREGEEEAELVAEEPYSDLYTEYIRAMLDYYNGDSARYNDGMVMFNTKWDEYAAYYRRTHKPSATYLKGMLAERVR